MVTLSAQATKPTKQRNVLHLLSLREIRDDVLCLYYVSCVHTHNAEAFMLPRNVLYTLDYPIQVEHAHADTQETRAISTVLEASRELPPMEPEETTPPVTTKARRWVWKSKEEIQRDEKKRAKKRKDTVEQEDMPDLISLPELVQPASVEQTPNYIKVHHNVGDEYLRARAVIGYPAVSIGGWFNQLLSIDEPYLDFLLFIEAVDPTSYVRSLTRAISGYRATQHLEQRHGRTEDPYIQAARNEVEELRDRLVQKVEQVFAFSLYVCTRAESRQTLKERDAKVASLLRSMELVLQL